MQEKDEEVFKVVEQMPRFPSAECEALSTDEDKRTCANNAMMEYIIQYLKYPKAAQEAKVEGMSVVQFIVEKDGSLSNIKLLRDIGAGCGEAAKSIVEQMNIDNLKWTPGVQRGRKVRVQFVLPVKFKLTDDSKTPEFDPKAENLVQTLTLEEFQLSPNPSSGEIQLSFKSTTRPVSIQIYDAKGSNIYEASLPNFDGIYI